MNDSVPIEEYRQVVNGLALHVDIVTTRLNDFEPRNRDLVSWNMKKDLEIADLKDKNVALIKAIDALKFTVGTLDTNYEFVRKENDALRAKLAKLKPRRKR